MEPVFFVSGLVIGWVARGRYDNHKWPFNDRPYSTTKYNPKCR